jgi:hypothetical protein
MRRAKVIQAVVSVVVIGCLVAAVRWLWTTPLSPILSKAAIGKLNLEQPGANLQVSFVPPKSLSSITLFFPKPMQGSGEFCAHPDFTLSVRVRLAELGGTTNIIDELITKDRMQWTSWHAGPSLLLLLHGWLGEHLNRDREYDLTVTVDSAVADIGQAEVFLHWMDYGYVWGRETQNLQLTRRSTE